MTIGAVACSDRAIVIAADDVVGVGNNQHVRLPKVFVKNKRFGIFSFGSGPITLPEEINASVVVATSVQQCAIELGHLFDGLQGCKFHLLVAGFEEGMPQVWLAYLPDGPAPQLRNPTQPTHFDPVLPPGAPLPSAWKNAAMCKGDSADRLYEVVRDGISEWSVTQPPDQIVKVDSVIITAAGATDFRCEKLQHVSH
jgi:hypothetical protein